MTSGIFLIQDGRKLVRMDEAAYDSEDLLQALLEEYPDLLAGDQMQSNAPRRWLLVRREIGIPGEQDGSDRWSLDHLFLDQDAIPTLVEVKRSSDTRIRREVVGQMLDYAANAVAYWPVEQLRAHFEQKCESKNQDADEVLTEFLGDDADVEEFWQKAKTNLQAGRIRMVFVADVIPNELKRIVEFLNEQMDPAQVLAVEIKQYVGEGLQSLVPRVIGQTAEAEKRKGVGGNRAEEYSEQAFLADLSANKSDSEMAAIRKIVDWMRQRYDSVKCWKGGKKHGIRGRLLVGKAGAPFAINEEGNVNVAFPWLKNRKTSLADESKRTELLQKLNEIPGVDLPANSIHHFTTIPILKLAEPSKLGQFLDVAGWCVDQIREKE